jgi:hypothetical protein
MVRPLRRESEATRRTWERLQLALAALSPLPKRPAREPNCCDRCGRRCIDTLAWIGRAPYCLDCAVIVLKRGG